MVAGRKIVGYDRKHSLTDAHIDRVGDPLDLHDDTHCRKDEITVRGGEDIDADICEIEQTGQQRGRNADRENVSPVVRIQLFRVPQSAAERGRFGGFPESVQKVEAGNDIGKKSGDSGAGHLVSSRKNDKHKKRIEDYVQDPAPGESCACLRRITCVPQNVGKGQREDRRHAADNDHKEHILPRIADRGVGCSEKTQHGIQKNGNKDGVAESEGNTGKKTEGAD